MILDNLFMIAGGTGTAMMLLAIVAFVGFLPASAVMCPASALSQRLSRGR
jgi:hypothetical protein